MNCLPTKITLVLCAAALACACGSRDASPPDRDPTSPIDDEPGRRVRRLTADQFHRSLQVATGQTWSRYGEFAAALGKPDFAEITDEGIDVSVTFDKLVHDAARETCAAAVASDRNGGDVILRHASLADRSGEAVAANLRYLMLRFLGFRIDSDDDPRLSPWLELLAAGEPADLTDDDMASRWAAVCIGLVTHPDFLTY